MYLTHLDVRAIDGGKWKLLAPLDYYIYGLVIRIDTGFETDLASIPKGFRWLISQNERHRKAAVTHDGLYDCNGNIGPKQFTREQCDRIFYLAMIDCGVPEWKRNVMYKLVRWFGWRRWELSARD